MTNYKFIPKLGISNFAKIVKENTEVKINNNFNNVTCYTFYDKLRSKSDLTFCCFLNANVVYLDNVAVGYYDINLNIYYLSFLI